MAGSISALRVLPFESPSKAMPDDDVVCIKSAVITTFLPINSWNVLNTQRTDARTTASPATRLRGSAELL